MAFLIRSEYCFLTKKSLLTLFSGGCPANEESKSKKARSKSKSKKSRKSKKSKKNDDCGPKGCGDKKSECGPGQSSAKNIFFFWIYLFI